VLSHLKGWERFDDCFIDYLKRRKIRHFDFLQCQKQDYGDFAISPEQYIDRYYIKPAAAAVFGHWNALGNLFFAMAIKDELVDWLQPKPPAYR